MLLCFDRFLDQVESVAMGTLDVLPVVGHRLKSLVALQAGHGLGGFGGVVAVGLVDDQA